MNSSCRGVQNLHSHRQIERAERLRFLGDRDPLKSWSEAKSVALLPKNGPGVISNITWITFKDPKWKVPSQN
jgi:hypothetical protein